MVKQFDPLKVNLCYRSWGFRLIGGMDEGLVLKIDKVTSIINKQTNKQKQNIDKQTNMQKIN